MTGSSPTLCTGCCLKELLICNLRLIKQRNIVCKATLLHELPRIKLFRTDQDHSSHLCFAYFDHVFLPSPLIAFYLIKLALMLCNIYTKQILKSDKELSSAWKSLTTATAPILNQETASYSLNFNVSLPMLISFL